jgi:cytochrome c-type biogenesis protein
MVPLIPLNLVIAFAAGFLTFFAGCLAPIAPVYVGFLAGSTSGELDKRHKWIFTKNALLFTSGFILVFLVLGLTINTFARSLAVYRPTLEKIAGLFLIVFGLHMGKFITIPVLNRTFQRSFKGDAGTARGSFLLGTTFGFTWTPCIGPVLAAILFWVGSKASFVEAIPLLLLFSFGLGLPFILIGLGFDKFSSKIKKFNEYAPLLNKIAGIFLIIFGVLLFTGKFFLISTYLLGKLGSSAFIIELKQ